MLTSDFDYHLPPQRIAQEPAAERTQARLFVHGIAEDRREHRRIADLPDLLAAGDLLVLNHTRVFPARLHGHKDSGGAVEVLLIHALDDAGTDHASQAHWLCYIRGKVRVGTGIRIADTATTVAAVAEDGTRILAFPPGCDVLALAEAHGRIPLPPYIKRADTPADRERYQTEFARVPGSVAAPTAGLHLTTALLDELAARGVERAEVELAIGPGTFKPVDSERIEDYAIHAEHGHLPQATVSAIDACKARGGRVIAIGTTVVRVLETAARQPDGWGPWQGWSRLYLHPPQGLHIVDALLTNFHLPRSSLLMLVSCLTGRDRLLDLYREAIAKEYRFYSYGDAMLLLP